MTRLARAVIGAAALAALPACEPLDPDVFRCEEAMARVLDCCPAVERSPVVCAYGPEQQPLPPVDCLVGKSCAGLRELGACAWAEAGGTGGLCP